MDADPTRRIPSDLRPKTIAERVRIKKLAKSGAFTPPPSNDGPHYRALLELLGKFVGTPHERFVWDIYFNQSRMTERDRADVTEAATEEGLSFAEYVSRETLTEILRRLRQQSIAEPSEPPSATPLRKSAITSHKGVSLLDAAFVLQGPIDHDQSDEELRMAAVELKTQWQKNRGLTRELPPPIGFDPRHSQTHLYDVNQLVECLTNHESYRVNRIGGEKPFIQALRRCEREPRPQSSSKRRTARTTARTVRNSAKR